MWVFNGHFNSVTTGYGILQKGGENWSLLLLLIAGNENLTCISFSKRMGNFETNYNSSKHTCFMKYYYAHNSLCTALALISLLNPFH